MSQAGVPKRFARRTIQVSSALGLLFSAVLFALTLEILAYPQAEGLGDLPLIAIVAILIGSSSLGLLRRWRWAYGTFVAWLSVAFLGLVGASIEAVPSSTDVLLFLGFASFLAVWIYLLLLASVRQTVGFRSKCSQARLIGWAAIVTGALNLMFSLHPAQSSYFGMLLHRWQATSVWLLAGIAWIAVGSGILRGRVWVRSFGIFYGVLSATHAAFFMWKPAPSRPDILSGALDLALSLAVVWLLVARWDTVAKRGDE